MERVAIIGTAASWKMTPWNDPGLKLISLNDAYRMQGFQRADQWYDFHPLDKFFHPPKDQPIYAHQIPPGFYCRPKDHLEWLGKQASTIPVWLSPGYYDERHVWVDRDYRQQYPPAAQWPNARQFPLREVEAHYGTYFTSSPAFMIAHVLMQGCKELHIYGIHLATEFEYMRQRPNFEFLCGSLLGAGKRTMTVKDGLRRYESPNGLLVLPEKSPVLQENFQYAFQPRPDSHQEPIKWELHKYSIKRERAIGQLKAAPWWQRTTAIKTELARVDVMLGDLQEQLQRPKAQELWSGLA